MSPPATSNIVPAATDGYTDLVTRLQHKVLNWQGVSRNQPITELDAECRAVAGTAAQLLLPEWVFVIPDLDAASLRRELARRRLLRTEADPRFRVRPAGRFDAVLVPGGPSGRPCDRWWMFVEESLSARDQHALYAHALAHGL
jgi:hypothetical protein